MRSDRNPSGEIFPDPEDLASATEYTGLVPALPPENSRVESAGRRGRKRAHRGKNPTIK